MSRNVDRLEHLFAKSRAILDTSAHVCADCRQVVRNSHDVQVLAARLRARSQRLRDGRSNTATADSARAS
jgi:hypothetical protein